MRPSEAGNTRALGYLAAGIAVLLVGILIGGHPSWLPSPLRSAFTDQSSDTVVAEGLDALQHDYYRPLSRSALANGSLQGVITSLKDPYSHYISPTDYRSFLSDDNPHLSGIGIDVELEPRGLRVLDVFPHSPAAQAGLTSGDLIIQAGSVSLAGHSSSFGSRLIKGPAGTRVTLTVLSGNRRRTVTITRANLTVPVADATVTRTHGIKVGVVQLTSFTDGSGAQVRQQVQSVLHQGARALVLDLRSNGGGLLEQAVTVASIFIPDGTIVSTEGRSQPRQVYVAQGGAISTSVPLVVLVDHGTASAAEIVTGALRDRGRAKVIGTRTYGKGVFQEIQTLSNGGALEIVTGRWFEPSGRNVGGPGVTEGVGIKPDIEAATNPTSRSDTALELAERTVAAEVR